MTVYEIVRDWLAENGYDALRGGGCGCLLADMPDLSCVASWDCEACHAEEVFPAVTGAEKEAVQ
jgi:hypothetical protein